MINEEGCGVESFPPELLGHVSMSKKCEASFDDVPVFTFGTTVLLVSVWAWVSEVNA